MLCGERDKKINHIVTELSQEYIVNVRYELKTRVTKEKTSSMQQFQDYADEMRAVSR